MNCVLSISSLSFNYVFKISKTIPRSGNVIIRRWNFTINKINKYLLDRSVPASDILKNLNDEDSNELKKIKFDYEFHLSNSREVPKNLTDEDYLELLCLSKRKRMSFFKSLFQKECKVKPKKEPSPKLSKDLNNRVPRNCFIIHNTNDIKYCNINNAFHSIMLNSQELVFDMSFEENMSLHEIKNLGNQMIKCLSLNRTIPDPFAMILANLDKNGLIYNYIRKFSLADNKNIHHLPWVIDERNYSDIFPGRRLIYLSPNSNKYFMDGEYDHNAVYIIGGIADKGEIKPITVSKARRENIEHRAFPIDRFIDWKIGSKSLDILHTLDVLRLARETNGDWRTALFEAIPPSALIDPSEGDRESYARKLSF